MSGKKIFQISLGIIVLAFLVWFFIYAIKSKKEVLVSTLDNEQQISLIEEISFFVDEDKKSIIKNGDIFLDISDDRIFSWFKEKSGLCDEYNIENTKSRKSFCSDKEIFSERVNFVFVENSQDFETVIFVLESYELVPDRVIGGVTQDGKLDFLTSYYLGNEFLGFSPDETYFLVKDSCFEAKCGISVYDTKTLSILEKINDIPGDERVYSAVFIEWSTNKSFSYKLGDEIKELVLD